MDALDDDAYVAELLAKDARDSSLRYSAMGLEALLPKRPVKGVPKPNTRFLRNVIRETDSHNAALKKKEELEARMRLKGIPLVKSRSGQDDRRQRGLKRGRDDFSSHDDHRRDRRKRLRSNSDDKLRNGYSKGERRRYHSSTFESDDSDSYARRSSTRDRRGRKHHGGHKDNFRDGNRSRSLDQRPEQRNERHRRRTTYHNHNDDNRRQRKRHVLRSMSDRSSSSSRSGSQSPAVERSSRRNYHENPSLTNNQKHSPSPTRSDSSTSDPLESIVGPLPASSISSKSKDPPPIKSRGRGACRTSASAMDSHFKSSYDPSLDLHPESEADSEKEDWEMALEALKDREVWKRKGAERLRAAGFREDEVKKWENSGKEKGAEDVRWASKGDKREWDIGKVVLNEPGKARGEIGLEAAWTRKESGFLKDLKKALR